MKDISLKYIIECASVEARFLHDALAVDMPLRPGDTLLELQEDDFTGLSKLIIESKGYPLALSQRQFLVSCGLQFWLQED